MRWSLILSTTVFVLSTLSAALVIPSSSESVYLEKRAKGAKTSNYRKQAPYHPYLYKFDQSGVTREKIKKEDLPVLGKKQLIRIPNKKEDADHIFEHQMLMNHLDKHGLKYENLDGKLQNKVKKILNSRHNLVLVPASHNRRKGQLVKQGSKGKALKNPNEVTDQYAYLSYKSARKVAKKFDRTFKKHGYDFKEETFGKTLRDTMNNAKIMNPGDPSPETSSNSGEGSSSDNESSKASSGHPGSPAKP